MVRSTPPSRKVHIIRKLGTNRAGEVIRDFWLDIERIDEAKSVTQEGGGEIFVNGQGQVRRLKWQDDPRSDDYNADGNQSRKIVKVKVCSPEEENPDDPEEWVEVEVIRGMRSKNNDQGQMDRLINDELTQSRRVEKRRVSHRDTTIDDEADAAFDADPDLKVYVVKGDEYDFVPDSKDDEQYVEVEVIKWIKSRHNNRNTKPDHRGSFGTDQGRQTRVLSQYLIDETDDARLEVVGSNGFNPPYRLDPYQNIVNVNYGAATNFEVGSNIETMLDLPNTKRLTIVFWIRVRPEAFNSNKRINIIRFGQPVVLNSNTWVSGEVVSWLTEPSIVRLSNGRVGATFRGPRYTGNLRAYAGGGGIPLTWNELSLPNVQNIISQGENADEPAILPDEWAPVMISVNTTGESRIGQFSATSSHRVHLWVNGIDGSVGGIFQGYDAEAPEVPINASGAAIGRGRYNVGFYPDPGGLATSLSPEDGGWTEIVCGPFDIEVSSVKFGINGNSDQDTDPESINSFYISNEDFDIARCQIWFDRALDFSQESVREKFVVFRDGKPKILPLSVSEKAYGKSHYLFDGGASAFVDNKGTVGEDTENDMTVINEDDITTVRSYPKRGSSE